MSTHRFENDGFAVTPPLLSAAAPYGPGAKGWENGTIGAFLDAAATWGKASVNGLPFYKKPENPRQRAAQILHAEKCYE